MRDAFGGAFMIKLLLIFLTIYIAFIAVALNYAKAFRVKNKIIDIIEQNEGIEDYHDTGSVIEEINNYLATISYNINIDNSSNNGRYCYQRGYCISENSSTGGTYYKVTTYVRIQFPFFGLNFSIPINGETRKVNVEGYIS